MKELIYVKRISAYIHGVKCKLSVDYNIKKRECVYFLLQQFIHFDSICRYLKNTCKMRILRLKYP